MFQLKARVPFENKSNLGNARLLCDLGLQAPDQPSSSEQKTIYTEQFWWDSNFSTQETNVLEEKNTTGNARLPQNINLKALDNLVL